MINLAPTVLLLAFGQACTHWGEFIDNEPKIFLKLKLLQPTNFPEQFQCHLKKKSSV